MKKSLLLITLLLAVVAMPIAAQQKFIKKHVTMSLIKKRGNAANMLGLPSAQGTTQLSNQVVAIYSQASASGVKGMENYYLILSDKESTSYDVSTGVITASDAKVVALNMYAPEGTGITLPTGKFAADEGNLYYDSELSFIASYDANGKKTNGDFDIDGDITVSKAESTDPDDAEAGAYTISLNDENGTTYVYEGELSFTNMASGSSSVYPQITTDLKNLQFNAGLAFYHGNLMESNTGNMILDLYTGEYDPATGGLTGKGIDFCINLYNRLFGDPSTATVIPGTYTVARNFHVNTFFPGMEINYMGVTMLMGTYVKRRTAVTGLESDYDYCYIADGTITITEGAEEGTFDIAIDCVTDRGHKVTGTAKGIRFTVYDESDHNTKDVDSNLTEDVDLKFDRVEKSRIYNGGEQNGVQVFTVDLGSPSGKDDPDYEIDGHKYTRGDQDLLRMEFQCEKGSQYLQEGTYTLMDQGHLWTNLYAPFMLTRGYFDNLGGRTGTVYQHFMASTPEDPHTWVVDKYATIYSGTVGVSKTDNNHYKFVIDLYDGNGFKVSGEFDKEMEYNYDPSAITTGINGIADNAASQSKAEVYTMDGQLIKTVNATPAASVSNLPGGVYIVKTNNKTIKIVKK